MKEKALISGGRRIDSLRIKTTLIISKNAINKEPVFPTPMAKKYRPGNNADGGLQEVLNQ